jgi:hypothetical protein
MRTAWIARARDAYPVRRMAPHVPPAWGVSAAGLHAALTALNADMIDVSTASPPWSCVRPCRRRSPSRGAIGGANAGVVSRR